MYSTDVRISNARLGVNTLVSTEDDSLFVMIDSLLGNMVDSLDTIDLAAGEGVNVFPSELSANSDILAIMDISSREQAVEQINRIRIRSKHSKLIVINRCDMETLEPVVRNISAIIPLEDVPHLLAHIAYVVVAGMSVVPGRVHQFAPSDGENKNNDPELARLKTLSCTEARVLLLLTQGLSNKQIAREIEISDNTVRVHIRNIFLKLSVQNRTQAALLATRFRYTGVLLEKAEPRNTEKIPESVSHSRLQ